VEIVRGRARRCSSGCTSSDLPGTPGTPDLVFPPLTGVGDLRRGVRQRIKEEGLRPFSLRTGIPLGQLRSVVQGHAARNTTLTAGSDPGIA